MRAYIHDGEAQQMFSGVRCLIYVFDVHTRIGEIDMIHFEEILDALRIWSPSAVVYTLLHKTDLLTSSGHTFQMVLKERKLEVEKRAIPTLISHTFATSIWDESLYRAWSAIFHGLLPTVKLIESQLGKLCQAVGANEVALFEPNTLLLLAHHSQHVSGRGHHHTPDHQHRHEKLSIIVKRFRMACISGSIAPKRVRVRTGGPTGEEEHVCVVEKIGEEAVILVTGRKGHLNEVLMTSEFIKRHLKL